MKPIEAEDQPGCFPKPPAPRAERMAQAPLKGVILARGPMENHGLQTKGRVHFLNAKPTKSKSTGV